MMILKNTHQLLYVIVLNLTFLLLPTGTMAQKKIKPIKNSVAWRYTIAPKAPLEAHLKTYQIKVDTDLNPMDLSDEMAWSHAIGEMDSREKEQLKQKAIADTLRVWSNRYIGLKSQPFVQTETNPDFVISLSTMSYATENVQLDVDFSDMESAICNVNAAARLTVLTKDGSVLLDETITYYIDELEQSTLLPIRHFMLNPVFKLKYNLKKKPEKKKKLLERKLKKYEAVVLEYFFQKSGKLLRENYTEQQVEAYAVTYGIKNKGHEALNEASHSAKSAINSLSALSEKKRKSLQAVRPEIRNSMDYWQDKLERTTHQDIQKYLWANLSLGHLLLDNTVEARNYLLMIPESKTLGEKTHFQGGFDYFLNGLSEAISLKEQFGELAQIQ